MARSVLLVLPGGRNPDRDWKRYDHHRGHPGRRGDRDTARTLYGGRCCGSHHGIPIRKHPGRPVPVQPWRRGPSRAAPDPHRARAVLLDALPGEAATLTGQPPPRSASSANSRSRPAGPRHLGTRELPPGPGSPERFRWAYAGAIRPHPSRAATGSPARPNKPSRTANRS